MVVRLSLLIIMIFVTACDYQADGDQPLVGSNDKLICRPNFEAATTDVNRVEIPPSYAYQTPTIKILDTEWPQIIDDLNFEGLELALSRQLERFERMGFWNAIVLGNDRYKLPWIQKSLIYFRELIYDYKKCVARNEFDCREQFAQTFKEKFVLYKPKLDATDPRYGEENPVLFTAYYTPTVRGSRVKTEEFRYAVYKKPWSTKLKAHARVDIDFRKVFDGQGLELFYTNDLFNLYLMHLEGGGRVVFNEGHVLSANYLTYDGANGLSWRYISNYMREKNYISDTTISSQRDYLSAHPESHEEIFSTCPSYVYFKRTSHEPLGSDNVALTNNRSIATDDTLYKFKGLLTFVTARRPVEQNTKTKDCKGVLFKNFSRFYLDQDTGGSIRGKNRADLYFGEDSYAELAGHNLVERGQMYFAVLKR